MGTVTLQRFYKGIGSEEMHENCIFIKPGFEGKEKQWTINKEMEFSGRVLFGVLMAKSKYVSVEGEQHS